ncbi:MAG: cytochrome bc1 complex Rieske iron-sulfur subunit [Jatrophihabitans sp.]
MSDATPEHELTPEEISELTADEAMIVGAARDGVQIVHRRDRFPIPGTRAEKRAERAVSACFAASFLAALGFIVVFVAVPFKFHLPGHGSQGYVYYTPLLGGLLGLALVGIGVGAVLWAKLLMPEEEAVQDRHGGPSPVSEQMLTTGTLISGLEDTGLARRSMLKGTLGLAGAGLGIVPLVALVGGMLKKPGNQLDTTLWGKNTPLVYSDGRRVSPGDLEAGGIATVFPGVPGGVKAADSPTLLIRLQPGQTVKSRKGQAGFNWGDYIAFSKICTHAGCPASLYEHQTGRLLCPCHQSQFNVLEDAKPVFGPATRSLPGLPLSVQKGSDGSLYFVSRRGYDEAIGPAFWERR